METNKENFGLKANDLNLVCLLNYYSILIGAAITITEPTTILIITFYTIFYFKIQFIFVSIFFNS